MALTRRRVTKKDIKHDRAVLGKARKTLECKECGMLVDNVVADTSAITCAWCVVRMVAPPDLPAKPKPPEERKPRGWQFMKEYRAPDGTLYHRGVKVDETITTESTNSTKRPRKRKTDASTTKSSDHGGHSKGTKAKSTTGTKRKSVPTTGRSVAGAKTKRSNSAAKQSVKRKARRPAV